MSQSVQACVPGLGTCPSQPHQHFWGISYVCRCGEFRSCSIVKVCHSEFWIFGHVLTLISVIMIRSCKLASNNVWVIFYRSGSEWVCDNLPNSVEHAETAKQGSHCPVLQGNTDLYFFASCLHWLDLGFLYAFFVQWSIFPTKLNSYPDPSPFSHFEALRLFFYFCAKRKRERVILLSCPKKC